MEFLYDPTISVTGIDPGEVMEKEVATHSSTLAWETPWSEEPGGYSPWGHKGQTRLSTHIQTFVP